MRHSHSEVDSPQHLHQKRGADGDARRVFWGQGFGSRPIGVGPGLQIRWAHLQAGQAHAADSAHSQPRHCLVMLLHRQEKQADSNSQANPFIMATHIK